METIAEDVKQGFKNNAELVIKQLTPLSGIAFGYNTESVQWLEGFIDRMRSAGQFKADRSQDSLIGAYGSFLGECIIQCFGGDWVRKDGMLGVQIREGFVAYPFNKVGKQMENGTEDGIGGYFSSIPAILAANFQ